MSALLGIVALPKVEALQEPGRIHGPKSIRQGFEPEPSDLLGASDK